MLVSRRRWLMSLLAAGLAVPVTGRLWAIGQSSVKVALLDSVFVGQDRDKVVEQIKPFAEIVKKDTGIDAVFDVMSLDQVEKEFKAGTVQVVILTGLEYAWLHATMTDAKALLVASIDPGATRTVVVVKQDDVAKDLKELQDAKVAVPDRIPFISEQCLKTVLGQPTEKAFKIVKSGNVDDTLEELLDGKVRAAIVTGAGMEVFKERKPGRYKKLKALYESVEFPPTTVMYNQSNTDEDSLTKFKDALLKAHEKPEGSRVLTLYKLKGFEVLPEGYDKKVEAIAKAFPR